MDEVAAALGQAAVLKPVIILDFGLVIVSSVAVYNELLARRPDLVGRLYEPFRLDTREEGLKSR